MPVHFCFLILLSMLGDAPLAISTTHPTSQPAGPSLKDEVPPEVRSAWENREAVRAETMEALQKELTLVQDEILLVNAGKIDPKQYADAIVEKPVHRYVFKSSAAKAERRRKQQDIIDDLRQQMRVADAAIFPLPYLDSYDELDVGWIGMLGAEGTQLPVNVVQIVDANCVVVGIGGGITPRNIMIEGVSTSGLKTGRRLPKPLPIWITGSQELPQGQGNPQKLWTAKQFFPESYVVRNRAATVPAS